MRFPPTCQLATCVLLGAVVGATSDSVLEVDLVFPRNETYEPTDRFPIVFAFQNAKLAKYLNPHIDYTIFNWANLPGNDGADWSHDLRTVNWSSTNDPYFAYNFFSDSVLPEGQWKMTWSVGWQSCNETAFSQQLDTSAMVFNSTTRGISFTIKKSAPKVDLVSATADKTSCSGESASDLETGVAIPINVTGKTMEVPSWVDWSGGDTCAVVASSIPTPTVDPCRVKIDSAIEASMSAAWTAKLCRGVNPPPDCPEDDRGAAQKLVVVGVSTLFAAFGALGFLLSL
ncbi:uncharacterized protein APUU_40660S [Aspergillus puulaauensis]|uniref:DUF7136 domain-containing protein n=1 Tax=Aspergillus puulaauensis TaxID=1220207 RepID=A0A7R7XME9_9EURO|nr:uncharacterized protein APUU_40660S [Aspergillus puulaauensis]BCS24216.1 hypothetical protein APUU_40660S [Aspergillus puulaauensis]